MLVNFRVDPATMQRHLPAPFRPKLHRGHAIAGVCLIRLENIRPPRFPSMLGLSSENAAHRMAVAWEDGSGSHEGVYIPRRDTGSLVNHLGGGRLFPGEHQRAHFRVVESETGIAFHMQSADGRVEIDLVGHESDKLAETSAFATIGEASAFFESGSVGYSATSSGRRLDGLVLKTHSWSVKPLAVEHAYSSYFSDQEKFPPGSVAFDCALIMRNVSHEWDTTADLYL
jgi:hypothetical protein